MATKAKQRFTWLRDAKSMLIEKIDKFTASAEDPKLALRQEFDLADLPESIRDEMTVYGATKIIDDRNSQVAADDKMTAALKVWAQFIAGVWIAPKSGGGGFTPPIITVIMQKMNASLSEAQASYRKLDKAQKDALKEANKGSIAAVVEAQQSENTLDLDGMKD